MGTQSNWAQIKATLQTKGSKELLTVIGELYRFSKDNKEFLEARFTDSKDVLKEALEMVKDSIDIYDFNDKIDFASARKAISNYKKARPKDMIGHLELMFCYVESGNDVTLGYGDMWEQFYINIENMYEKVCKMIVKLSEDKRFNLAKYQGRLHKIVTSTSGIGWGYHDTLKQFYNEHFD